MRRWDIGILFIATAVFSAVLVAPPASAADGPLPDPATGVWSSTGDPAGTADVHLFGLPDGTVLSLGSSFSFHTQRWSPVTGAWTAETNPAVGRNDAASAQLADGRVILIGGDRNGNFYFDPVATSEIFDPSMGTWSAGPTLAIARSDAAAAVLPDGRILVAGGASNGWTNTTEILDVVQGTSSAGPPLTTAVAGVPLRVLGGGSHVLLPSPTPELYDVASNTWTVVARPSAARSSEANAVLPDGRLIAAGSDYGTLAQSVEIFDPTTATWSLGPPLITHRSQARVAVLPGGRVLVVGGRDGGSDLRSAESLDLARLADGWRPVDAPAFVYNTVSALLPLVDGDALIVSAYSRKAELFDATAAAQPYRYVVTTEHPAGLTLNVRGVAQFSARLDETTTANPIARVALLGGVVSGPNAGAGYCEDRLGQRTACVTSSTGHIDYEIVSTGGPGTDLVQWTADLDADGLADGSEPTGSVSITWTLVQTFLYPTPYLAVRTSGGTGSPLVGRVKARLVQLERGDYGTSSSGIPDKPVRFTVGGQLICTDVTDYLGVAECPAPADHVPFILNNGYDAHFDGEVDYLKPSRAHAKLYA